MYIEIGKKSTRKFGTTTKTNHPKIEKGQENTINNNSNELKLSQDMIQVKCVIKVGIMLNKFLHHSKLDFTL